MEFHPLVSQLITFWTSGARRAMLQMYWMMDIRFDSNQQIITW